MSTSVSNLVDNLSEILKKNANRAWKEKKNRSECDFIRFKNNRLNYSCQECGKKVLQVNK